MEVGQIVRVLEDQSIATVLRITRQGILLKDEFGFEQIFQAEEVVLHDPEFYSSSQIQSKKEEKKKHSKKNKIPMHKVDLHRHALCQEGQAIDATELIFLQKQALNRAIGYCKQNNIKQLDVIYGLGDGVVQAIVFDVLEGYVGIEYDKNPFFQNQSGNTIVYFR